MGGAPTRVPASQGVLGLNTLSAFSGSPESGPRQVIGATSGNKVVAASTSTSVNIPLFSLVPGNDIGWLFERADLVMVTADNSAQLQVQDASIEIDGNSVVLVALGVPTATLTSPRQSVPVVYVPQQLILSDDLDEFSQGIPGTGRPYTVIGRISVKNNDAGAAHTFQLQATIAMRMIYGLRE
jgi:hypothetical protein